MEIKMINQMQIGCSKEECKGDANVYYKTQPFHTEFFLCFQHAEELLVFIQDFIIQPERSKREDFVRARHCGACYCGTFACDAQDGCPTKMRCSEHCGNTVRDK